MRCRVNEQSNKLNEKKEKKRKEVKIIFNNYIYIISTVFKKNCIQFQV